MIPKIIHYCWFGKKPKPLLVEQCIVSWNKILPDYKIICWDESNIKMSHPFLKMAYRDKQWAFVADFVRLQKLSELGGVYLDTDMMLIKTFNPLMINNAFIGLESARYISCGIIGAEPNHPYILSCYKFYNNLILDKDFSYKSIIIPKIFTEIYRKEYNVTQFSLTPNTQDNLLVCPIDYFYPFPNENLPTEQYREFIKPSTYAIHLWHKSWKKTNALHLMRKGDIVKSFSTLIKEMVTNKNHLNKKYFRKFASAFKQQMLHE